MSSLIDEARKTADAVSKRKKDEESRTRQAEHDDMRRRVKKAADDVMAKLPDMVRKAAADGEYRVCIYSQWGKGHFDDAVISELMTQCRQQDLEVKTSEQTFTSANHDGPDYTCDVYVVWDKKNT